MDTSGFQKDANSLGSIVKGLGVFSILQKGLSAVTASLDSAISRYDTLNKYPKVLEQMGYSSEAAASSTQKLSDGISGLPTTLDSVVSTAQRLTVLTGNLERSTDLTIALNNAFLASGSSSDNASRGLEQYVQMLSSGKVDMESWKTLQETMGLALNKTAEAFGFAGESAQNDLYAALQSGEITFNQFSDMLLKLNEGVGGFAEMAMVSTGGIGTAWTNLRTGIVKGTASIITAIDSGLSQTRFKSIENIITTATTGIKKGFALAADGAEFLFSHLDLLATGAASVAAAFGAAKGFQAWKTAAAAAAKVAENLKNGEAALTLATGKNTAARAAATAAAKSQEAILAREKATLLERIAAEKAATAAELSNAAAQATGAEATALKSKAANAAQVAEQAQAAATAAGTAATTAETAAVKAETDAENARNTSMGLGTTIIGVLTGQITLHQLATVAATVKTNLFSMALNALPFVAVAAAAAALVAGIVALVKWLAAGSEEYQRQTEEVKALTDAQEELTASMEESSKAFDETAGGLSANAAVASGLVDEIESLQGSYDDMGDQADRMAGLVGRLNSAVDGLNVTYDRETGAIRNLNTGQEISLEQLRDLVDAKSELAKSSAWTERQSELLAEQVQIQEQLALIEQKRQEILDDANLTAMQQATLLSDLTASEQEYTAQMEESEVRLAIVNEQIAASSAEAAQQIVSDYELMESAVTESGENIQQVAEQWGVSTEDIISAMKEQDITLDEWVSSQEEAWAELEDAVREKTDSVVNSFERIPDEFEMSAQKMLENLQSNKELYARWEANMEEITRQLGPTAAEEFSKLGPEANSAVEEILGSTELLQEYRDVFGVTIDEATGQAVEAWNDPNFIGAPTAAVESSAAQIAASTALGDAAQEQVEGTKQAFEDTVEAVDFTSVGQTISGNIADGFSSLDLSSVAAEVTAQLQEIDASAKTITGQMTRSIASAISSGSSNIKSQTTRMSTGIVQALESMVTGGKNQAERMLTNIAVSIAARMSNSINQTKAMVDSIVNAMEPMVTGGKNQAERMLTMAAIAIAAKSPNVTGQARTLSGGVVSELNSMASGGYTAGVQLMNGVVSGMAARQSSVYAKANQIANNVAATMRRALQIHSPSRVMMDIFENVMLGVEGGMESMEDSVYATAGSIAGGIAKRLTISPELAGRATSTLLGLSNGALASTSIVPAPTVPQSAPAGDSAALLQKAVDLLGKYLPELANLQINMDAREVGRAIVPYVDEQLAF